MGKVFLPILMVLFLGAVFTEYYTFLAITVTLIVLLQLLLKFGKGIALLEVMAIYCCIIYLLVPLLGYSVYTRENKMAILWQRVMPVDERTYYSYILPAIIAYLIGLFFMTAIRRRPDEDEVLLNIIVRIKQYLLKNSWAGIRLIVIGLLFFVIKRFLPGPLGFVGSLCYLFTYVGALYLYFQPPFKGKWLAYLGLVIFVFMDAINSGMFTLLFYMSITIASFFVVGWKIRFPYKVLGLVAGLFCITVLQLVKSSFRRQASHITETSTRVDLFQNLVVEKSSGLSTVFSKDAFFGIYVRLNQGWMTALVMKRIPARQPYDGGESIIRSVGASVIPRVLWPDKPEAGGVYNMEHFAGWKIRGWSTNIGPVGEGYGNFGPAGGIAFMFFFGWFIGLIYVTIFKLANKLPLLILWFPLLFFEVMYSMENDTLQALNSLIKASFFVWIVYKMAPRLFGPLKSSISKA